LRIEPDFRVLVVEDEALISMLIEDMLGDIGCECVDVAASVEAAMESLGKGSPDFALLDINLNGKRSFPVADLLLSRDIPFVFLSGYDSRGLDSDYAGAKILQKPFQLGDLQTALDEALRSRLAGRII
jgi:CheY-like chemotaxis protein